MRVSVPFFPEAYNLPNWFLYWGWIGVLVLGIPFNAANVSWLKRIGQSFGRMGILWALAVGLYTSFDYLVSGAFVDEIRTIYNTVFTDMVSWIYRQLNAWLSPWTDEIIFLLPMILIIVDQLTGKEFPKAVKGVVGIWFGLVSLYFIVWSVQKIFNNPTLLLVYVSTTSIVNMFAFATGNDVKSRYSSASLIRGLKLRSAIVSQPGETNLIMRQFVLATLIAAFWFQLSIDKEALVALYSTFFTGMLTIVGFAALIFTFAFERIPTAQMRRYIAQDTKAIYRAVGLIAAVSAIGLLFLADRSVVFDIEQVTLSNVTALCFLIVALLGTVVAVESTIMLFRQLIDVLSGANLLDSNITVAFDELRTPAEFSAMSENPTGLSNLREHIEDFGMRVVSIETGDSTGLSRLRDAIIVIQRVTSEISEGDAAFYREYLERGDVIIVLVDALDLDAKQILFEKFEIDAKALPFGEGEQPEVAVQDVATSLFGVIGAVSVRFEHPVAFRGNPKLVEVARSEGAQGPWGELEETIVIAKKSFGRGLFIVVGSVAHWQNQQIFDGNNLDCLNSVIRIATDHIRNRSNAVVSPRIETPVHPSP